MIPAKHWHAYAWVGHERPADSVRLNPDQPTPPLEISHWLRKPARHVAETFPNSADGISDALAWVRAGALKQPDLSEDAFPLEERMVYVEDDLTRGSDMVWGYYSKNSRYVSSALVACPRKGVGCPYGH